MRSCVAFLSGLLVGGLLSSSVVRVPHDDDDTKKAKEQKKPWWREQQQQVSSSAGGVAVTVYSAKRVRSMASAAAKLATVVAASPWPIDVYASDVSTLGGRFFARSEKVTLLRLEARLAHLDQRALLLSVDFWRGLRHSRVLWFELGTTVMCSGSPLSASDALFAPYDWIGARWKKPATKPGAVALDGGNGAFSLRNRDRLVEVLLLFEEERKTLTTREVARGNEDRWFVRQLQHNLAPGHVSDAFAVEELFPADRTTAPVGVYHQMRTLPYDNRSALIKACPEAKLLFQANHDPRCAAQCPRNRSLLEAPLREWTARCGRAPSPPPPKDCELSWSPPRDS